MGIIRKLEQRTLPGGVIVNITAQEYNGIMYHLHRTVTWRKRTTYYAEKRALEFRLQRALEADAMASFTRRYMAVWLDILDADKMIEDFIALWELKVLIPNRTAEDAGEEGIGWSNVMIVAEMAYVKDWKPPKVDNDTR